MGLLLPQTYKPYLEYRMLTGGKGLMIYELINTKIQVFKCYSAEAVRGGTDGAQG